MPARKLTKIESYRKKRAREVKEKRRINSDTTPSRQLEEAVPFQEVSDATQIATGDWEINQHNTRRLPVNSQAARLARKITAMDDNNLRGLEVAGLPAASAARALGAIANDGGAKNDFGLQGIRVGIDALAQAIDSGNASAVDRLLTSEMIVLHNLSMDLIRRAHHAEFLDQATAYLRLGLRAQRQVVRTERVLSDRKTNANE